MRRVAVTGLGLVCPVGNDIDTAWAALKAGQSGIRPITTFDTTGFATTIAGTIVDFDLERYLSKKDARKMDPFIHYAIAASVEAIGDAGIELTEEESERAGVVIGSGIGGLPGIEQGYGAYMTGGARRISPFFVPANIINMASGNLSIRYGFRGPNYSIVTACSTGAHCIADAGRLIGHGDVDVMVAGGAEMATCPTGIGGFASARALSTRNDAPTEASRPWDRERDGFVLSDGAGVVVLEEMERAKSRGAHIYAELVGYAWNSDAYHMTSPQPEGEGASRCMRLALKHAELNPEQVNYVNAHGTSTPAGDVVEARAVKSVFGDNAKNIPVSSTKSMIGHMLGAAGGAEAVITILALRDQVAPPTINLHDPDEECDLDFVPHEAREMAMEYALSNSFGFGGTNGSLIFKRGA